MPSLKHSLINDRRLASVGCGQKLVGSTESHKFSLEEAYRLDLPPSCSVQTFDTKKTASDAVHKGKATRVEPTFDLYRL